MGHGITSKLVEGEDRKYKKQFEEEFCSALQFLKGAGLKSGKFDQRYIRRNLEERFEEKPYEERKGLGVSIAETLKQQYDGEFCSAMRFLKNAGLKSGAYELGHIRKGLEEEFLEKPYEERKGLSISLAETLLITEYGVNLSDYLSEGGGHEVLPEKWRGMVQERVEFAQADDQNRSDGVRFEDYAPQVYSMDQARAEEEKKDKSIEKTFWSQIPKAS